MKLDVNQGVKDATMILFRVKQNLTHERINLYKGVLFFILIGSLFLFGWLWKSSFMLKLSFITCMLILIALFALDYYFYGGNVQMKTKKKPKKTKPNKESLLGFDPANLGLPDADEYNKRASKAILGN